MLRLKTLCWLMVWALAGAACDDSAGGATEVDASGRPVRDMGVVPPDMMAVEPDMGGLEADMAVVDPDGAVVASNRLLIIGDATPSAFVGEDLNLVVRYLSASDAPNEGAEIHVRLIDGAGIDRTAAGIEGSTIAETTQVADAEGEATFLLSAGGTPVSFVVEASADDADPVRWNVTIDKDPEGTVRVRAVYVPNAQRYAIADVASVTVELFQADCALIAAQNPNPLGALPAIAPFDGDDQTTSDPLAEGLTVSALATGLNAVGAPLARGCVEGIAVVGGATTDAMVTLEDMPLEFKGLYDVNHELDITELLAADEQLNDLSPILDIIGAIGGGLGMPPHPRGDGIVMLVCDYAGVDEADCLPLRLIGAALIEDIINDFAPPEVIEALDVLGDLYRILAQFQVYGQMEIRDSRPNEDNQLLNNESRWQGLRFVWRQGCPFDDIEQCTRDFSLIDAGVGRDTFEATFDADLQADDVLYLHPHQMRLHIGRLAAALLETWVLPEIVGVPGPVRFDEFFAMLIDCPTLNEALPPFVPDSGVCEATIVQPLADLLYEQIDSIAAGADLFTFEGTVTVADRIVDLSVDRLENGVWDASFGNSDVLIESIGTFSGCRVGQCPADLEAEEDQE